MHHDLAGISFIEAEEDRHQRRFPGAVLADNAMDGPSSTTRSTERFA